MTAARNVDRAHGFHTLPAGKVARLPLEGLLDRIEAAAHPKTGELDPRKFPGILGTVSVPEISLAGAWNVYWEQNEH
jgi:hypothetical protein